LELFCEDSEVDDVIRGDGFRVSLEFKGVVGDGDDSWDEEESWSESNGRSCNSGLDCGCPYFLETLSFDCFGGGIFGIDLEGDLFDFVGFVGDFEGGEVYFFSDESEESRIKSLFEGSGFVIGDNGGIFGENIYNSI
jgi:hypothetical protein